MRIFLSLAILFVSATGTLCAQEIAKEQTLDEVTIVAHSVIEKGDRKLIHPTQNQIKTSTSGLDLLSKLQLPRITVDIISGEITTSGNGEVQLRMNGVQVSYAEISALNPADILRIEYHDVPGARYGNAAAVIDYITRTGESGGNIRGGALHSIGGGGNRLSIDDMLSGKYTQGKSEWAANAHYIQRRGDWTREYDERFIFPDKELHRVEMGEPSLFNKKLLTSNLSYSLQEQGMYFFNAQLKYTLQDNPAGYEDRKSKLYSSDSDLPLSIYDHTREKNHLPAIDLYYLQYLRNDQLLIFNVVGTYIKSNNTRIYQETQEDQFTTDLLSDISGKKYSLIAEGIYEKKLSTGKFTGGLKHMQSYTNNQYSGNITSDVQMQQSESYAYAEYQGKIQRLGYRFNGTLSRFYYSQSKNRNEKYGFQPSLLLTYTPTDNLNLRYNIHLKNNTPSIGYLNDVEQPIDNLQIRRGNPTLQSFHSIMQEFNAVFTQPIWSIDALIGYNHEKNPIMESVIYENGLFIRTYNNQKSFQHLNAEVTLKLKPWKDYITLSVTPAINRYISTGNNYCHTYTMKELRVNVDANYKNLIASFMTIAPPNRNVYGEQLMKGDLMHVIMLGYTQPAWSVMAGVYNPFVKTYRSENANWSTLNPVQSDIHTNNMSNAIVLKFNFNLNFGKQTKGMNKILQNMDIDPGIMQGVKN